jgi:hypothetical protein
MVLLVVPICTGIGRARAQQQPKLPIRLYHGRHVQTHRLGAPTATNLLLSLLYLLECPQDAGAKALLLELQMMEGAMVFHKDQAQKYKCLYEQVTREIDSGLGRLPCPSHQAGLHWDGWGPYKQQQQQQQQPHK